MMDSIFERDPVPEKIKVSLQSMIERDEQQSIFEDPSVRYDVEDPKPEHKPPKFSRFKVWTIVILVTIVYIACLFILFFHPYSWISLVELGIILVLFLGSFLALLHSPKPIFIIICGIIGICVFFISWIRFIPIIFFYFAIAISYYFSNVH